MTQHSEGLEDGHASPAPSADAKRTLSRKEFLRSCSCAGAALLSLPLMASLQGCSSTAQYHAEITKEGARVPLSAFNKSGVVVLARSTTLSAPVLVKRVANQEYVAVLMKCSHKGCELVQDGPQLSCPCHGSEFTQEGHVLSPPATQDLVRYPVRLEADSVVVQIASQGL